MSPDPLPPKPPPPGAGRPGGPPSAGSARGDAAVPPRRDGLPRLPATRPPVGRPATPSPGSPPPPGFGTGARPPAGSRPSESSRAADVSPPSGSRAGESAASGRGAEDAPRTVTKKELVARIADRTAQTKVVARDIVQMFLDEIIRELGRGNRLEFREFGVFEIKERAARRAQNPRTLEKVDVPAKRVVKFRVGRMMKELVGEIPEGSEHIADGSDTWDDEDDDD